MATVEQKVPPLMAGDKLDRDEFLRRWQAHPEIKKAELIGGIVYMPSPVSAQHGRTEGHLGTWVGLYSASTPGTDLGHNATSLLLDDSPQPDVYLRIVAEYGGQSRIERGFVAGSPEFVAEICRSSAAYDLHQKFELYQEAGVKEYLAVLLYEKEIRWHVLVDGSYQLWSCDVDGIHRSQVFPGLWLDGQALLEGNLQRVLAKLNEGIASAEHADFVKLLASRQKPGSS